MLPELLPQVEDEEVLSKGRLGPGNMITLDLESGEFRENTAVKQDLATQAPYPRGPRVAAARQTRVQPRASPLGFRPLKSGRPSPNSLTNLARTNSGSHIPSLGAATSVEVGAAYPIEDWGDGSQAGCRYGDWLKERRTVIEEQAFAAEGDMDVPENLKQQLTAFGWSLEDSDMQVTRVACFWSGSVRTQSRLDCF